MGLKNLPYLCTRNKETTSINNKKGKNNEKGIFRNDGSSHDGKLRYSLTGAFTAYDLDGFKLHVYNTNDVMGDASYIIEGQDSLIVMEYPLFKVNAAEFAAYIEKLGKPVEIDVTDYHLGGSDKLPLTMPEGMPAFIEGPVWRHDGRVAHAEGR